MNDQESNGVVEVNEYWIIQDSEQGLFWRLATWYVAGGLIVVGAVLSPPFYAAAFALGLGKFIMAVLPASFVRFVKGDGQHGRGWAFSCAVLGWILSIFFVSWIEVPLGVDWTFAPLLTWLYAYCGYKIVRSPWGFRSLLGNKYYPVEPAQAVDEKMGESVVAPILVPIVADNVELRIPHERKVVERRREVAIVEDSEKEKVRCDLFHEKRGIVDRHGYLQWINLGLIILVGGVLGVLAWRYEDDRQDNFWREQNLQYELKEMRRESAGLRDDLDQSEKMHKADVKDFEDKLDQATSSYADELREIKEQMGELSSFAEQGGGSHGVQQADKIEDMNGVMDEGVLEAFSYKFIQALVDGDEAGLSGLLANQVDYCFIKGRKASRDEVVKAMMGRWEQWTVRRIKPVEMYYKTASHGATVHLLLRYEFAHGEKRAAGLVFQTLLREKDLGVYEVVGFEQSEMKDSGEKGGANVAEGSQVKDDLDKKGLALIALAYLDGQNEGNKTLLEGIVGDRVKYCYADGEVVSKERFINEAIAYWSKWPSRFFVLEGLKYEKRDDAYFVNMRVRYSVSNGAKTGSGRALWMLTMKKVEGLLKIVGFDEVVERGK